MEGRKLAPQAEQERKQCKQREEHHITLDTKIFSDCISPLLLMVHLQLVQIWHLEQVKKRSVFQQLKFQPFVWWKKINSKCGNFNTDYNFVTVQIYSACFLSFLSFPSSLFFRNRLWCFVLTLQRPFAAEFQVSRKPAPALPSPGSKPAPSKFPIFGIKTHGPGASASCKFYLYAKQQ